MYGNTGKYFAPSHCHLFGPLKYNMRGQHYKNDEAVQQNMHTWLQNTGRDYYCTSIFSLAECWLKCLDHSGNFKE
jgi:hypothetical protein